MVRDLYIVRWPKPHAFVSRHALGLPYRSSYLTQNPPGMTLSGETCSWRLRDRIGAEWGAAAAYVPMYMPRRTLTG